MQRIFKSSLMLLACSLVAASASARGMPALNGKPWAPEDEDKHCFRAEHGSLTNVCDTEKGINFALTTDTSGDKTVNVSGIRPNGSTFSCQALGIDALYLTFWANGFRDMTMVNVRNDYALPTAFVPAHGTLIVQCKLGPNATIYGFDWNQ